MSNKDNSFGKTDILDTDIDVRLFHVFRCNLIHIGRSSRVSVFDNCLYSQTGIRLLGIDAVGSQLLEWAMMRSPFWDQTPLVETRQGPQMNGIWARFGHLANNSQLGTLCSTLNLTTPTVLVANKVTTPGAREISLTDEEKGILAGLAIPRGYKDERTTPLVDGQFNGDSGILTALNWLNQEGVIAQLPTDPRLTIQPHEILFSATIRFQSLSVLWDIVFDGVEKGSPFGRVKPWVIEELQVLGFITLGVPFPDGKPGRPPQRIIVNSWGREFARVTKECGIEVTDVHRQSARKKTNPAGRPRFNTWDMLANGLILRGYEVPKDVQKKMSRYGREHLKVGLDDR